MTILGYVVGGALVVALILAAIGPEIIAAWIDHANNKEHQ